MGDRIRSFRDLRVYQEAFRLQLEVFEVSKGKYVSEEEHASLMNQCPPEGGQAFLIVVVEGQR